MCRLARGGLFFTSSAFWALYGLATHSAAGFWGGLLILPGMTYVLARVEFWRHARVNWAIGVLSVASFVAPTMLGGWAVGTYGVGAVGLFTRLPQLIELVREKQAGGVSAWSWVPGTLGSAVWAVYWAGQHQWAAFNVTVVGGVTGLVVAALATWRHHQRSDEVLLETEIVGSGTY